MQIEWEIKKVEREIEREKKEEIRIEEKFGLTLPSGKCMTQEKYTTWFGTNRKSWMDKLHSYYPL